MGWFSRRKDPPGRKEFREEFETVTARLRTADEIAQVAVGHCINLANTFFVQQFTDIKTFRACSEAEKFEYIKKLTAMEEKMMKQDPHAALGFGLFKMWIGAITANDEELVQQFSEELAFFSKKGNLGG